MSKNVTAQEDPEEQVLVTCCRRIATRKHLLDMHRRTILDSLDELAKLGCNPYEELSRAVEHVFMEPEEEDQ